MFDRYLKIRLPEKKSAFLWGARQTGKSTYLRQHYPNAIYYDLLKTDLLLKLRKQPSLLREEILALDLKDQQSPIIIDEIQKEPLLLDEVHWLIENASLQFILCGSSARKLHRIGTNLLGGRALKYHLYPLSFIEITKFNLLCALQQGLIPTNYLAKEDDIDLLFEAYVNDYLKEEIQAEGLVRDLPQFARFLDSIGFSNGQMVNYSNIARDCGVGSKTVENYYQILIDTLVGVMIPPYHRKIKRDIISKTPKFYLFDVGIANYLSKRKIIELSGSSAGEAFEHYILMELIAYKGYLKKRFDISYWRTKTGLEVDYILGDAEIAIEVKISKTVRQQDLKGLIAFCEEHHPQKAIVVSQDANPRLLKINDRCEITILPWREFLTRLWQGEII